MDSYAQVMHKLWITRGYPCVYLWKKQKIRFHAENVKDFT